MRAAAFVKMFLEVLPSSTTSDGAAAASESDRLILKPKLLLRTSIVELVDRGELCNKQ